MLPGARGLSYSRDSLKRPLLAVMGMALLVLLIATVNVASLLLVRSAARVREFSLRYALGATARHLIAQLLIEGLVIGVLGAAAGAAMAPLASHAVSRQMTAPGDTDIFNAGLDPRLLIFSLFTAMTVSVLFSTAPALEILRPDLAANLKQQMGTVSRGGVSYRRFVVCLQVGLSVVLLVGAGLFVRTLDNLQTSAARL